MSPRRVVVTAAAVLATAAATYPVARAGVQPAVVALAVMGLTSVIGAVAMRWRPLPAIATIVLATEYVVALVRSNSLDPVAPLIGTVLLLMMELLYTLVGPEGGLSGLREIRVTLLAGLAGFVLGEAGLAASGTVNLAGPEALAAASASGLAALAVVVWLLRRAVGGSG